MNFFKIIKKRKKPLKRRIRTLRAEITKPQKYINFFILFKIIKKWNNQK